MGPNTYLEGIWKTRGKGIPPKSPKHSDLGIIVICPDEMVGLLWVAKMII